MKKNRRSGSKHNSAVQNVNIIPVGPAVPQAALTEDIVLQFGEKEVTVASISKKVKQNYKDSGNAAELKEIKIYVKPEENKAYYVANGQVSGNVDLV